MYTIVELCFLCHTNYKNLISILSQDSDGVLVEEKLRFFLSELVNIEPEITKYVCFDCLKNLNHVYSFKQLCLRNIDKLSSYIRTLKSTDEPYRNLQVRLIDSQSLKENQVISENESNKEAMEVECINIGNVVKREPCEQEHIQKTVVDEDASDNVEKNNAQEVNVTKEKREEMIVDSTGIEYILQGEYIKKIVDIEEILRKENNVVVKNELEDTSYNAEYMKAQEENFIKLEGGPIFEDDKLEHETVDIKEEPTDIYDKIYLNSESDDDLELQNETTNNTEDISTCTTGNNKKLYKCDVCEKAFAQNQYLKVHKRKHTGERPYKCDVCEKTFCDISNFNMHKRIHTGEKRYQCGVCDKAFYRYSILSIHKHTHFQERTHKCDMCDKAYYLKDHLLRHKIVHTRETPYACDLCDKTFYSKYYLIRHKRTHNGKEPYHCEICDKTFYNKCDSVKHKRSHSSEKLHECDVCGKTYSRQDSLTRHKLIHSDEKPYECNSCTYKCRTSHHLKLHVRQKHDNK